MLKPTRSMLVLALCLSGVLGGATCAQTVPDRLHQPITAEALDQRLFNEAVLLFSNAARRQHGRAPLSADPDLARAATEHANNMARLRRHSHELPVRGQRHLGQRIKRQSVQFRLAGENIAMDKVFRLLGRPISTGSAGCSFVYADTRAPVPRHSYASLAEQVVGRWLASPKHRDSLLSSRFQRIGSGIGIDPSGPACGDLYLVQDFAD
jgi:uncharacterized protein YkwD